MRIDGNRNEAAATQNQQVDKTRLDTPRPAGSAKSETADRVAVSSDAALANAAVKAASDVPDIRMDLVNRMRALMANGQLGADTTALADSLIDHLLGRK